jgi:diacylglycerol kinase (ATP)
MNAVSQPETPVLHARLATLPDPSARRVLIAASLHAGSRRKRARLAEIADRLTAAGYAVQTTDNADELASLAGRWHERGDLRAVVAGGGDGTALLVRSRVPPDVPMLPLPLGTESLLGRYVSQSSQPAAVCRTLDEGVSVGLDLGRAGGRPFLLMISAGFDAEVVRRLHQARRGHITRLSYIKPTLATIRSYAYPELQLYCEGQEGGPSEAMSCRWLFGFNLPTYACGWQLAPHAAGTDGLLDVCTFQGGSLLSGLRYLWHVVRGSHLQLSDAQFVRCSRFRLEAAGGANVAYQLDGDWGGVLPVDVEVAPGQCRLLVARDVAERLGFTLPDGDSAAALHQRL